MTQGHPITPPSELIRQIRNDAVGDSDIAREASIVVAAYRAGADAELEACVEWLGDAPVVWKNDEELHPGSFLRDARRPKRLKEQALETLETLKRDNYPCNFQDDADWDIIRRALETIPDV